MRLGIMQPYFFPYLAHFALISKSERWIVFDVTQYTPRSWMSRNRVLHPQAGWTYVGVPLRQSSISLRTHEARLSDPASACQSLLGKLSHYKRHAPYYDAVRKLVMASFANAESDSLVAVNVSALALTCRYLGIPFDYRICSELDLDLHGIEGPGDWAPEICRQLNASSYLNPVAGRDLFDAGHFLRHGIELGFLEFTSFTYPTGPYTFEPGLSILDVMMWNSPERIRQVLHENTRILF